MKPELRIRGHHLLCMYGFRGLGYSQAFIENMRRVVDAFFASEPTVVNLVEGGDDICSACPHLQDGECKKGEASHERLGSKDSLVLAALGLEARTRRTNAEIRSAISARISPADIRRLCPGCYWLDLGYCEQGIAARNPLTAENAEHAEKTINQG